MNTVYPITDAPLIYDISFYQEEFKFAKLALSKQKPVAFYLNAGIGLTKDVQFARNWQKCGELGYYRQSYWAYHPDYSYVTQVEKWYEQNPEIDMLPRIMDLEREKGIGSHIIAACTMDMSDIILARDGHRPWIYGRKLWLERVIFPHWDTSFINEHYYILAEYNKYRNKEEEGIDIPAFVEPDRVLMKQTADEIPPDPLGLCPGFLDRNRWLHGGDWAMDSFLAQTYGLPEEPVSPNGENCCEELQEQINGLIADAFENAELIGANATEIAMNGIDCDQQAGEIEKLGIRADAFKELFVMRTDDIAKLTSDLGILRVRELANTREHNEAISKLETNQKEMFDDITTQAQEIEDLRNKTIPECNHSHWWQRLFNRR
jgi:hypothetical protein